jgi:hypothetical protein
MYSITPYSKTKAKELKVAIKPSSNPKKKLDVFENGKKYSIGDIRYLDYPNYIQKCGKEYADERRRLYHIRQSKGLTRQGQLAKQILW